MNCNCNGNPCQCRQGADDKTPLPLIGSSGTADMTNLLIGPGNNDYGRNGFSTSSFMFDPYHPKSVIDVKVDEVITITYIKRAMYSYTTYNNISLGTSQQVSNPDIVFKEVYGVVDGKLTLIRTINGRIIPPKLEESYEFDEE